MLLNFSIFDIPKTIEMISVKEAIKKVIEPLANKDQIEINLSDALGFVLAKDIHSPIAMPPFSQSAMDGYAICGNGNTFTVIGEIKAGDAANNLTLTEGNATRIFTGAIIPEGTTAIAKQEIVDRDLDTISLQEPVKEGMSIRKKGEEIALNGLALTKNTLLTPAGIGFLSGLGIEKVIVFKKPSIAVIVTGNELTKPGNKLSPGKIYESNSSTLKAALKQAHFNASINYVKDDFESTKTTIQRLLDENDVVIATGGISVGDYDFVGKSFNEIGVEEVFYKVKQKPGKPLFYGKYEDKKVFGLPGNPAAVLSCFYMYVLPALKTMQGYTKPFNEERTTKILHDYAKKGDRAHLLKAFIDNEGVRIHNSQSSAMLSSFVEANCLLFLDENVNEIKSGDSVKVYMLPKM